ncbi:hypothetical protein [Demequina mangrovi]|uniref:DUF5666 domain-containing protein n=1 Tax=Demequina mangrovi TaxID=1043493 RepID=A0A1H6WY20_9MICO|nr:hypothetical protein [Demequina mangrovi]SEJ21729.1 hypothetical protein SAMN05421637_1191 [Demequina mangrovi]
MRIVSGLATALLALSLAACESRGDDVREAREADAIGTVTSVEGDGDTVALGFAPDPGYEYFEGTVFEFADHGTLATADGEAATAADVAVGDHLEVWVEMCAESFPVQCPDPIGRLGE